MKLRHPDGEIHDYSLFNTIVTTYRTKVWWHMNHLFHVCDEACPDGTAGEQFHLFNQELVKRFLGMRYDQFIRWEPDDEEKAAWQALHGYTAENQREVEKFRKELENFPWDELEGE